MSNDYRTLPNGDSLSLPEVEAMSAQAWADLGKAQRDPTSSPNQLKALMGKAELWSKVLYRGFEPEGQRLSRDADARQPLIGNQVLPPHRLDADIAQAWALWTEHPKHAPYQFLVEQLETIREAEQRQQREAEQHRQRFGGS